MRGGRRIFPRRLRRWPVVVALALTMTFPASAAKEGGERAAAEIGDAAYCAELSSDSAHRPVLRANRTAAGRIALTFDDGPHPTMTAPILDLLAEYGVQATFFVIGVNAEAHPDIVWREIAEGHEIGNHTKTHPDLSRLNYRAAAEEVTGAQSVLFARYEYPPRLLRPPGGEVNENLCRLADGLDYELILWSVDTRDWAHTDTATIVRTVCENISDGDVILFHDFITGEAHTLEALRELIPQLISRGYEFVTVSRLFGFD